MNKILILGRKESRPDYDNPNSLAGGLNETSGSTKYIAAYFEDLLFCYDGESLLAMDTVSGLNLKEFDGVFLFGWFKTKVLEDLALSVSIYCEANGVKILNQEARRTRSRSKLSQLVLACVNGVNCTPFTACHDDVGYETGFEHVGFGFPLIAKSASGNKGDDNYLVSDLAQLKEATDAMAGQIVILQHFIPNDGDLRLLVMGDYVRLAINRVATPGSHLNNTSKGGVASLIDLNTLPADMLSQAVKLAQLLGRDVTGVDMIVNKFTGRFYLLEVNNMPQLSSGSLVEEKINVLDTFLTDWVNA